MKTEVMPIPVEAEISDLVREGARATGLKLADVMRQGLRHGVPAFVERLRMASSSHPPKCLDYLDDYAPSRARAVGYKATLRTKLAKKHARADR